METLKNGFQPETRKIETGFEPEKRNSENIKTGLKPKTEIKSNPVLDPKAEKT